MIESTRISVLFIESNPRITAKYQRLIEESPYLPSPSILIARNLKQALVHLQERSFDLIIVNLFLPDSKGIKTFVSLIQHASQSAFVIITKEGHESTAFDAISLGAEDYLLEDESDMYTITRNIRNALERHGLKESLKAMSFTDELTSLYNRRGFFSLAKQQLDLATRENRKLCLFLIDLDHLKEINDTYGHKIGDEALIATAKCLKKTFRSSDIIGRIGGDEFAVLAHGASSAEAHQIGQHLKEIVELFNLEEKDLLYTLSLSYGISYFFPESQLLIEELFEIADQELYAAKKITHQKHK